MIFVESQKRENPKSEARNLYCFKGVSRKQIQMTKILNPKQKN